ncbi:hypothetical protein F511_30624, partial [Dorcoceras hygrometricum]
KEYSNRELVLKVMRALPREWDVKTMAMRESKDLNKLELHDLFANLKACEFELETRSEAGPSTSQPTKALAATTDRSTGSFLPHSRKLKLKNMSLKISSIESNSDEFEDIDILKTELSKLQAENEMLKDETSELKAEIEALNQLVSSWNHSSRVLHKLNENQKLASDKTGAGFNSSEFSEGETSTQSRSAYDKFNKMSFVKADMIYNCLESVKYDNQNSPKLSENGKAGIGFSKPESFKSN